MTKQPEPESKIVEKDPPPKPSQPIALPALRPNFRGGMSRAAFMQRRAQMRVMKVIRSG